MKNRKRFLSLALVLCLLVNLLPLGVLAEEIDPSEETTVTEGTTAPTDAPEGTTAPTDAPEGTTAPADAPEGTTAPAEEPEETTAPAEEPEETTAPAEEPEETTAPEEEAGEDEETAEEDSEESEESEEETESGEPEDEAVAVTDEATNITVIAPGIQSVTVTVVEAAPVSEEHDVSITYSIKVTDVDGNPYTGSALVKVPVPQAMRNAAAYYGDVDGDPVEVPMPVDGFFSIEVPHFSDLTISADYKDPVNITLFVGQTYTVEITGENVADKVTTNPGSEVTMMVEGCNGNTLRLITDVNYKSAFAAGKFFYLYNVRAEGYLTNEAPNISCRWGAGRGLRVTLKDEDYSAYTWTISAKENGYSLKRGEQFVKIEPGNLSVQATEEALTFNWIDTGEGYWNIRARCMDNGTEEVFDMFDLDADAWDGVIAYTGVSDSDQEGSYWKIYEKVEQDTTYITFEGKSLGTTRAVIDNVTYNITVTYQTVDIIINEGFSKTVTIDGYVYTGDDISVQPDTESATISVPNNSDLGVSPVAEVVSGRQYLFENNQSGKTLTAEADGNGLKLDGTATVDSTHWWTVESTGAAERYTVRYGSDSGYLSVANGSASISDAPITLQLDRLPNGYWLINDNQGWYGMTNVDDTSAQGGGDAATTEGSWWTIYERIGDTEITFTGVKAGTTTTAIVGHVKYNITVKAIETGDIPGLDNIVGAQTVANVNMTGKTMTSLVITEGTTFKLGVDLSDYDAIEWSSADTSIATVAPDGTVTAVKTNDAKAATTNIIATVVKDGIRESISIPVTVKPSLMGSYTNSSPVFFYIENTIHTTPYYSLYLTSESNQDAVDGFKLQKAEQGQVIYFERPTIPNFGIFWFAAPDANYSLAYMSSTNTAGIYNPLKNGEGKLGGVGNAGDDAATNYFTKSSVYTGVLDYSNDWDDDIVAMLETAIAEPYNCDGGQGFSRQNNAANISSAMTFISNKNPEVVKKVHGIMPVREGYNEAEHGDMMYLRKDYRLFEENMITTVNSLVYYEITVTLERPNAWVYGTTDQNAVTFTNAMLTDFMDNDGNGTADEDAVAFFYIQEYDDVLDGFLSDEEIQDAADNGDITDTNGDGKVDSNDLLIMDITEALNEPWDPDETVRTLTFYVVYRIQEADIQSGTVKNNVDLNYQLSSSYSSGSRSGASDSLATMYVVGTPIEDVVIDYGLPVVIPNLTSDHGMDHAEKDFDTQYGHVTITEQVDENGEALTDDDDKQLFTLTYTPTSILTGPDTVVLHDKDNPDKVVNGFIVYPATTVFYEEGFADYTGDFTGKGNGSDTQEYQAAGEAGQNYGYTSAYVGNSGASSGTQATSAAAGTATFQFTGTGVDIYANCDPYTGGVIIQVRDANNKLIKFYRILTHTGEGTTDATEGQTVPSFSLPIFSVTDLSYGQYTVTVTHGGGDRKAVHLDGFRVYNTLEIDPTSDYEKNIYVASEQFPTYVDIRDCVLAASGVESVIDSSQYKIAVDQIVSMVYNADETGRGAIILSGDTTFQEDALKDILDNGPKNEFFLWPEMSITFQLAENAQNNVQIGMKAFTGVGSECTVNGEKTIEVNSTIDMFYDITPDQNGAVTIVNTGENPISLTKLKLFGVSNPDEALAPVTEELVSYAMFRMVRPEVFTEAMIVRQPQDASAALNEEMAISLEAAGTGLTYQWYWRNAGEEEFKVSQCTTDTYYTTMTKVRAGREIYCVVTDSQGNQVTSNVVTLKRVASTELAIVTQPRNSVAVLGEDMAVSLRAVGEGLKYQWYWRDAGAEEFQKSSCRTNTYYTTMNGTRHGREIYCVITDALGNQVTSNVVTIRGTVSTKLAITAQPQDTGASLNEEVAVSLSAVGDELTYQWYWRNAGEEEFQISSCRTNTYYTTMTKTRAGREIYCVITDALGNQVISNVVTLQRTPAVELAITAQPQNAEAVLGENMEISLEATGEGLRYQWYWRNAGDEEFQLSSCRTNTYYTAMNKARDGREIYCVVTDALGNQVTSDVVTLRRVAAQELAIVAQPQDTTAYANEDMAISLEAVGEGLRYQWYWRNAGAEEFQLSSCKTNTYYTTMNRVRNGREIYCVITDDLGNQITSDVVTLTGITTTALEILSQPVDTAAAKNQAMEISLEAAGEGLRYQWYWRNAGEELYKPSSCTTDTYYTTMTDVRNGREIYCVITDALGNQVVSEVVTLRMG